MSIALITQTWDHAPVCGARLLVLLAMADSAGEPHRICYAGNDGLARKARCSVRQLQRHLRALEIAGLIRRVHVLPGVRSVQWRVTPMGDTYDTPMGDTYDTPGGDTYDTPGGDTYDTPDARGGCHLRYRGVTSEVERGDIAMSPKLDEPEEREEAVAEAVLLSDADCAREPGASASASARGDHHGGQEDREARSVTWAQVLAYMRLDAHEVPGVRAHWEDHPEAVIATLHRCRRERRAKRLRLAVCRSDFDATIDAVLREGRNR